MTDFTDSILNLEHTVPDLHPPLGAVLCFTGKRYDVWFQAFGAEWHGVTYGDNTQICHVTRLKTERNITVRITECSASAR